MSTKSTALVIVVGSLLGAVVLNSCHHEVPETKIVKVPTVVTRTVTVPAPSVSQPTSRQMPQSCLDAIALTDKISQPNETISRSSGAMLDAMSYVTRDADTDDFKSLNKSMDTLIKNKGVLNEAVIDLTTIQMEIQSKIKDCRSEIASK